MGVDYTSGVLYGTFAREGTAAHKKLESIIETADSAEADVEGVDLAFVHRHGNSWTGDFCYAIECRGSSSLTTRDSGITGPIAVSEGAPDAIRQAIASLGLQEGDLGPIGHYLYTDVW